MLKLSENPPILPPDVVTLSQLSGKWWVAHTKSRFEKVFAWDLLHRKIGYFLPMISKIKISGGKKRHVVLPLFSSYVFFCGNDDDRYWAMTTNRLCRTIPVVDQAGLIRELTAIEKAILGQAKLDLYPFAVAGSRCRITSGVFKGLEGTIIDCGKQTRIVLSVKILSQGAVMEIDADLLEPIPENVLVQRELDTTLFC